MWRVACGVWRVACGVWRVACGVWRVACGVWRVQGIDYVAIKNPAFAGFFSVLALNANSEHHRF
ncbi:hypothetical protein HHSLTHF2_27040 [Vreelandella venusta]|uniref:Uncharacterized protein n=1 Tax=Halomonas hydrothermalis TaxID=115561 RepID=A0A6F8U6L0_9GAMM|nr:hypothetical protein HHSLTHF2_27040 [Halomonas hydrothermalis]